jgi:hypothetical protein
MADNRTISQLEAEGYPGRLESLQPLSSLETATKKRRALKKKAEKISGFTKSSTTASG